MGGWGCLVCSHVHVGGYVVGIAGGITMVQQPQQQQQQKKKVDAVD